MSVKLDVIARGATAAIDRNNPKARQDQWMLEVERAMLASTQPPTAAPFMPALGDAASAPIAPAVPDDGATPGPATRVEAQARARDAGHAAPAAVAGGSVHDIGAAYDRDERIDPGGVAPAMVPSAGLATPASTSGPSARSPVTGPASTAGTVHAMPGSGGVPLAFAQAAVGTGTVPPSAASGLAPAGGEGFRGVQAPAQAQAGLVVAAAAVTMPQTFATAAGLPPVVAIAAGTAPAEAEHQSAPAPRRGAMAAGMAAESEPYAPSNLHVIDGEDGIKAWVRDARMTPYQEQAVAQAMIAQFAQQGALVGSVTVNGRLIGARGDAERDEQSPGHSTSEPPATTAESITTVRGAA